MEENNPFHGETHLGNKKGPFSRIVKTALVGEMIEWRLIVPTSSRYVVLEKVKACFLTKTSLLSYPLVEISGIEPLTS